MTAPEPFGMAERVILLYSAWQNGHVTTNELSSRMRELARLYFDVGERKAS